VNYCSWCGKEILDEDKIVYSDYNVKMCCCEECAILYDQNYDNDEL